MVDVKASKRNWVQRFMLLVLSLYLATGLSLFAWDVL